MPLPNIRGLNFPWPRRNEVEQGHMKRPAGMFWTPDVPSVASSGTDDSMEGVETHPAINCVPSVPRSTHNTQEYRSSESYQMEEGLGALSLVAENGSDRSEPSSRTRHTFHANTSASYICENLGRWLRSPERHEAIACGILSRSCANMLSLDPFGESLRPLSSQTNLTSARIFEPQAGFGPRQLELRMNPDDKASLIGPHDIPGIASDNSSHVADLNSEDGFENITETHRENFRESLSNLAANDKVLADLLINRLGAQVNLILPLFDGRGLDALLLPEHSGNKEHARGSKPAQSVGSTEPNARGSTLNGCKQGANKRSRDAERSDNGKDQNSKRNKKDPPSSVPTPPFEKATRPRFKCPFSAKCCITHCRKNGRLSTSQGHTSIHYILDHFKDYHLVVRCQRCHMIFEGPTAVSSKNDHQRMCNTTKPPIADDVIDCDMKAKLEEKLRFRTWTLENEENLDMKSWILRNVATLSGITRPKSELSNGELKTLTYCERELAKWYTIWETLFEGLTVPSHPFHEPNVSQAVQNRQRFQFLFRNVVSATADKEGLPPANDFQGQTEWFSNCVAVTLSLLMSPSSENKSAEEEGSSFPEGLLSIMSSAIDIQHMASSLAPPRNSLPSSEPMTSDAIQNQQKPRHLVRQLSIPDATAGHLSPELQDPETIVPTHAPVPDTQNYGFLDPYGQTTHTESQGQDQDQGRNQTPPFGGIGLACGTCNDSLRVWVGSSPVEGRWQACPFCTMFPLHSPVAGDDEDLYNA